MTDLHLLTNLVTLNASSAGLTGTLDLHGITTLTTVDCNTNSIATLDVSGCTSLDSLTCNNNPFNVGTTLDLSTCTVLNDLHAFNCTSLQVIDLTNIGSMTGFIEAGNCPALTTLTTPNVTNVDQDIKTMNCTNLGAWSFPALLHVGGEIDFSGSGVITVSLPALIDIGNVASGSLKGGGCTSLTTLTLTNLQSIITGDLLLSGCIVLPSLSLPTLATVSGVNVSGCTLLTSISLAGGLNMAGDFLANSCPALSTFSVIGWVPSNATNTFNGDALNSASIDTILASGAAMVVIGGVFDLSGGTNLSHASWSAGALADETTLTTNGATVLSNP